MAVPKEMSGPSLAGLPFDFGAAAFFAVTGWLCFRMGFRTQLTVRLDHFEVVNLLTPERIAYRDVASVHLDWLSVYLILDSADEYESGGRRCVVGLMDALNHTSTEVRLPGRAW